MKRPPVIPTPPAEDVTPGAAPATRAKRGMKRPLGARAGGSPAGDPATEHGGAGREATAVAAAGPGRPSSPVTVTPPVMSPVTPPAHSARVDDLLSPRVGQARVLGRADGPEPASRSRPPSETHSTSGGAQRASRSAEAEARAEEARARRDVRTAERQRRQYERSEARRFTERARRRRLVWLVSLGVVLVLVLVVVFTAYSPLFAVRSVAIEGTSRVDAAQVETALSGQLGKPLALVDYGAIENQLAAFPLIQSYSTESQLPNTLVVHIVERKPVGAVGDGSGFDLVDPAGVVVEHADHRAAGFPLIDLAGGQLGGPGFLASTAVLRTLPADLLAKVESVSAATPDSVTLVLTGGLQKVIWGSAENSALKALVLGKLIGTQNSDSRLTYDVSSPQSPVIS
ncbi:hypothetical protein BH09ACT6_BH09ACT6_11470 [soil metagenome]